MATATILKQGDFDVSTSDFVEQAHGRGWPFWRGVIVGFCCSFPICYVALVGSPFFGLIF